MSDPEVEQAESLLDPITAEFRADHKARGYRVPTRCEICNVVIIPSSTLAWQHGVIRDGRAEIVFTCLDEECRAAISRSP